MPLFAVSYYLDKWVAYSKNLSGNLEQFEEAISGSLNLYKTRRLKQSDSKELIDRRNKLTTFIDKSNRILSDLPKYKKKFGKENASRELPDVSHLLDAIDTQIMNLIGYRIGLYLSQASIYICLHNINEEKMGDLIFTAQELNRKAFAELRDHNEAFEALLPTLPEKSNAECEEQFTIIEMLRLRRFFDAMQESLKKTPSENNFDKGYRYLSEAINRAKDNEAWGAMVALTGDLGEYCIERLDNTTLVVIKGLPYYTMERYQTRKKIYTRIKESYQFAETALSHLQKFSFFIQIKMENIIKYLTKTIDTMLQDAIFYRSGDEIDLYKEILDQIQEIMLVGDHLRDKFPQVESLSQGLKIQVNQELNIFKELIARKISAQQQEKLEKEELQKELKVKQKH